MISRKFNSNLCMDKFLCTFSTADILAIALVVVAVTVTDAVKGRLKVTIRRADLPGKKPVVDIPDPYVNVTAIGKMEKVTRLTKIILNSYKPVWNQVLDFCDGDWIKMEISVHDHDIITADDVLIPVFTRYC